MAYVYGSDGYDAAVLVARGAGLYPFYTFPLIRRVVDLATGVVVHSETIRRAVQESRPEARVQVIDHLAFPPVPPRRERDALRHELRLPREAFVVASFGQLAEGKRAEAVLDAFACFAEHEPRAYFLWVGDLFPAYDVRPYLRRLGIASRVTLTGRVPEEALGDYLALADVAINLRFPTGGEASGALMRLLAYGKPTLVSNVGWFAELPSGVVAKVEVGLTEVQDIVRALRQLAADPACYSTMSEAAREYARVRTPAHAAEAYLNFVKEIYARAA